MSRTLRYFLIFVLIIAAAIWISTVYKTCQEKKLNNTELNNTELNNSNTETGKVAETDDDEDEDLYIDEDEEDEDVMEEDVQETNKKPEKDEAPKTTVTIDDREPLDGEGDYLVVAGAFISKSNATQLKKSLAKKGFESDLRVFLGSDYHSVIVGQFETEREANVLAKKVGGEVYVHKKRYPKKKR